MKKEMLLLALIAINLICVKAQVGKNVVVEHFTNSVCSVCKSRNPSFYNNLAAQSNVIHLAIYPSSPYSSCLINQQNKTESDARANYYAVYGATPRLVISGKVISNTADYSAPDLFIPFQNNLSAVMVFVNQTTKNGDSILTEVKVKASTANSLGDASLYIALAEDTLFYQSPNGEKLHFDVFRKSINGINGNTITIPKNAGDSIVFKFSTFSNPIWNINRMYAMAILQSTSTKEHIQAARSKTAAISSGLMQIGKSEFEIFPNPTNDKIYIKNAFVVQSKVEIFDINGRIIKEEIFDNELGIELAELTTGIYLVKVSNTNGISYKKIIKQ